MVVSKGEIVFRANGILPPKLLLVVAFIGGAATGETAGQDVIVAVGDAMPQIRVTTSLADARAILSVAGYDEIRVSVSQDSAVSLVTEITRVLSAANRVVLGNTQDTLGYEAVLAMREGYVGELRLRPLNKRHFA